MSWTDSSGNRWLFGGYACYFWLLNDLWEYDVSRSEWAWISGSNLPNQNGVWGTLGTAAAGNMPSARLDSSGWIDKQGNLWLFGGNGASSNDVFGYPNDLWEFNPLTNAWTWVSGTSTLPTNCTFTCGQPGVYGTLGAVSPGNAPGGRGAAVSWTDSDGNFWLFGGSGFDSTDKVGYLNDLWVFSTSTAQWKWMGGSSTFGQSGVYGQLRKPSPGNTPGARELAVGWTDSNGNFWLFGGIGYDSAGNQGMMNDLWEFNPSLGEWIWMGGNTTVPPGCSGNGCSKGWSGVYGSLGQAGATNAPGARYAPVPWSDANGNLWLFGGYGYDSAGQLGWLNDLWSFDSSNQEWAWMSGNSKLPYPTGGVAGVYGSMGVPANGNSPGGRDLGVGWADNKGNLWMFGGMGFDSADNNGVLNDLWVYREASPDFAVTVSPASLTVNSGQSGTATLSVTPLNGFSSAISFSCSGLLSGTSCSFSPTTVTPAGGAASTTLTLAASASARSQLPGRPYGYMPVAALALTMCFVRFRNRRWCVVLLLCTAVTISLFCISACSGGTSSSNSETTPTPTPESGTVTVTATSGTLSHTAVISVTVN